MARDAVVAASALAVTNVGLGWYLGYRSFTAYLAFWLLGGFVIAASVRLKSRCVAGLEMARCRQIGGAGVIALHLASFVE